MTHFLNWMSQCLLDESLILEFQILFLWFFAEEPFSGLFVTIALLFGNTLILFHASSCKLYLMLMLSFWCGVSRRDIGSYLPKHDKSEEEHARTCGENLLEPAQWTCEGCCSSTPHAKEKGSLYSCVNSFYVMRNNISVFLSLVALLCIVKVIEGGERRKEWV